MDYEHLSPEQFEPKGPLFHGFARKPVGTRLETGTQRGSTDYDISDPDRTYATTDKNLAWQYAEHKSKVKLEGASYGSDSVRIARNNFMNDWSTDVEKPGLFQPNVAEVKLTGDIDVDPNYQLDGSVPEDLKAYRGTGGDIVGKPEFVPPGAQTSMLPHPQHGGRYIDPKETSRAQEFQQWLHRYDEPPKTPEQEASESGHPQLFDGGKFVKRDPWNDIFEFEGGRYRR